MYCEDLNEILAHTSYGNVEAWCVQLQPKGVG